LAATVLSGRHHSDRGRRKRGHTPCGHAVILRHRMVER
jgi:hypothetical protein